MKEKNNKKISIIPDLIALAIGVTVLSYCLFGKTIKNDNAIILAGFSVLLGIIGLSGTILKNRRNKKNDK